MLSTISNLNDFNKISMLLKLYLQNYKTPTCKLGFRNRSFDIFTVLKFGFIFIFYDPSDLGTEAQGFISFE